MSYRDNHVIFREGSASDKLSEVTSTVTALSITDNQDPSKLNKPCDVHSSTESVKKPGFKVGRKGSSKVAQWWTSNIKSNQNTFEKDPDDLNFAFLGTLQLTYADSDMSRTYTFSNVALAQGHAGANNNWWFGGKACTVSGSDAVTTTAPSSRTTITCNFGRGIAYNDLDCIDMFRQL